SGVSIDEAWIDSIGSAARRVAALESCPPLPPANDRGTTDESTRAGILAAMQMLERERFDDALDALDRLPPGSDDDIDVLLVRAVVASNRDATAEAERLCAQLLALGGHSAGAHHLMALCLEQRGDIAGAFRHERIAAYLEPTFAMPRMHL